MSNPVVAKRVREMQLRWFAGFGLVVIGLELMSLAHAKTLRGYLVSVRAANRLAAEQRDDDVAETPAAADSALCVDLSAPDLDG